MSKKANPKVIGGFVIGAIGITVVGLLTFGSGKIFEKTVPAVMFFDESVAGLNAGAPLTFQGVTIGSVTDVRIEYNADTLEVRIPVFVEFVPDRIVRIGKTKGEQTKELIAAGMRGQLVVQSLVTGQLAVNLDFHPDTPVNLIGADIGVPEIPTIKSGLAGLMDRIEKLPIQELLDSAVSLIQNLDEVVESKELKSSLASLEGGLAEFEQLVKTINAEAEPIMENIRIGTENADVLTADATKALKRLEQDIDVTLADIRSLVVNLDGEVKPLSQSIQDAAGSAESALDQIETTTKTVDEMISGDSPLRGDLEAALRNLAAAMRAIRSLASELERNPSALIRGKQ